MQTDFQLTQTLRLFSKYISLFFIAICILGLLATQKVRIDFSFTIFSLFFLGMAVIVGYLNGTFLLNKATAAHCFYFLMPLITYNFGVTTSHFLTSTPEKIIKINHSFKRLFLFMVLLVAIWYITKFLGTRNYNKYSSSLILFSAPFYWCFCFLANCVRFLVGFDCKQNWAVPNLFVLFVLSC